ncbi:hypothetical protein [Mycoplasma sp. E35C]|uniref:hypothetical protein n=1 Tax=Mycoplasma sp. E35C TaxID=2801918 RepID=UPI001CA3DBB8|nr:hypothetical protein [Mycoplasma sp. E35C]QZX48819.1 hypothetical protein JJE79_02040 [Mycoplasma sp. E35C]
MLSFSKSYDYSHIDRYNQLKLPFLIYLLPYVNILIFYRISTAWSGVINNPKIREIFYFKGSIPLIIHFVLSAIIVASTIAYGMLFDVNQTNIRIITSSVFVILIYLFYNLIIALSIYLTKKLIAKLAFKHCHDHDEISPDILQEYQTRFLYSISREYNVIYFSYFKAIDVANLIKDYDNGYWYKHEYNTIINNLKANISPIHKSTYNLSNSRANMMFKILPIYSAPLHGYHSLLIFILFAQDLLNFKFIDKISAKIYFLTILINIIYSLPSIMILVYFTWLNYVMKLDYSIAIRINIILFFSFISLIALVNLFYWLISSKINKQIRTKIRTKFNLINDNFDGYHKINNQVNKD